jgi:hypothetical protein
VAVLSAIAIARKLIHRRRITRFGSEKPHIASDRGMVSAAFGAIVTELQEGRIAPVEN